MVPKNFSRISSNILSLKEHAQYWNFAGFGSNWNLECVPADWSDVNNNHSRSLIDRNVLVGYIGLFDMSLKEKLWGAPTYNKIRSLVIISVILPVLFLYFI